MRGATIPGGNGDGPQALDRERVQAAVLRRFTDAIGGDHGAAVVQLGGSSIAPPALSVEDLIESSPEPSGQRLVSTWSRDGAAVPLSRLDKALLARALQADRAIVEIGGGVPLQVGNVSFPSHAVAAPIRIESRPAGVLYGDFASGAGVSDVAELGSLAEAFATTTATCLTDDGVLAATLRASGFDPLTGCLSPGSVLDALESEIGRSKRHGYPLSCCFIDLGYFAAAQANGNADGTHALLAAGETLRTIARRSDVVGRLGGDEFVAVLPHTNLSGALRLGTRIVASLRSAVGAVTDLPVSPAVGVAEWAEDVLPRELLVAADNALREARYAGGSRPAVLGSTPGRQSALASGGLRRFLRLITVDGRVSWAAERRGARR